MAANISPKEFVLFLFLLAHVCFSTIYFNGSPNVAKNAHFSLPKMQRKFHGDIGKIEEGLDPGDGYFSRIHGQCLTTLKHPS
ncbi:hypothetical protein HOLleu_38407 [Holothuria leucospilota]|uniref:Transmembrane protein n=1 Tax=Holothuria leucospilota TaxID=206669 RepID=A0A9Q1BC59_HOLLE|nr:hypothetical protein HOLleu_38407 [Holothuria leucospilota]